MDIPSTLQIDKIRERALRAIAPIKPFNVSTSPDRGSLFYARRTNASRDLPEYYLLRFLLVELLGFQVAGPFDKTAWSVAIDWKGRGFAIEHRKMGIGIFAQDLPRDEDAAREIAVRLRKGVKAAAPFFEALAGDAVAQSSVNVVNNSAPLFARYEFLRAQSRMWHDAAKGRHEALLHPAEETPQRATRESVAQMTTSGRREHADWLALSAVEAFFAWTEHIFIHLATLQGSIASAQEVAELAGAEWGAKYKSALDIGDKTTKTHYESLTALRRDVRNYVTHGAFGKQGEAFHFHSSAGAVPVLLPHKASSKKYRLGSGLTFDAAAAFVAMDAFEQFLWNSERAPARLYIQESGLPIILTYAQDGTYPRAMQSVDDMKECILMMTGAAERAADMDW